MVLYFVNGSKQKKEIIESDYPEDIIDMMIDFFEMHNRFPHMMQVIKGDNELIIKIVNSSEHFLVENIAEDYEEIIEWIGRGDYHG